MRALVTALAAIATGCGTQIESLTIVNETTYSTELARAMIDVSLQQLGAQEDLLDGWRFTMRDVVGETCPEGTSACTTYLHINVPFVSEWSEDHIAYVACHEVTHAYLFETTGDFDSTHEHQELFSSCIQVSQVFEVAP